MVKCTLFYVANLFVYSLLQFGKIKSVLWIFLAQQFFQVVYNGILFHINFLEVLELLQNCLKTLNTGTVHVHDTSKCHPVVFEKVHVRANAVNLLDHYIDLECLLLKILFYRRHPFDTQSNFSIGYFVNFYLLLYVLDNVLHIRKILLICKLLQDTHISIQTGFSLMVAIF